MVPVLLYNAQTTSGGTAPACPSAGDHAIGRRVSGASGLYLYFDLCDDFKPRAKFGV